MASIIALILLVVASIWFVIMTVLCNLYIHTLKKEGQKFELYTSGIVLDIICTLYIVSYIIFKIKFNV